MNKLLEEKVKQQIANVLGLTDEWKDGTYLYWLTRVKEAFNVGTMTLDDFVEVDEELVEDIYGAIKPYIEAKEIIIKTPELPESEVIRLLQKQILSMQQEIFRINSERYSKPKTLCDCIDWRDLQPSPFCPKCKGKGSY